VRCPLQPRRPHQPRPRAATVPQLRAGESTRSSTLFSLRPASRVRPRFPAGLRAPPSAASRRSGRRGRRCSPVRSPPVVRRPLMTSSCFPPAATWPSGASPARPSTVVEPARRRRGSAGVAGGWGRQVWPAGVVGLARGAARRGRCLRRRVPRHRAGAENAADPERWTRRRAATSERRRPHRWRSAQDVRRRPAHQGRSAQRR
jgi:hypothetical protein